MSLHVTKPELPAPEEYAVGSEPPPLGAVLQVLWRGRWILLGCALLALLAGFAYVERRGTVWRVSSQLYLERSSSSLMTAEGLLVSMGDDDYANSQASVMRSTLVLGEALGRPDIASSPVFEGATNTVGWLKEHLRVKAGNKDDILTVSLESTHVAEACEVVNAVVAAYRSFHTVKNKETVQDFLKRLQDERDRHRKDRDELASRMTAFVETSDVHGLESALSAAAVNERLNELLEELDSAEAELEQVSLELAHAEELEDDPQGLLMVLRAKGWDQGLSIDEPENGLQEIALGKVQLQERENMQALQSLRALRTELLVDRTSEHPAVQDVDQRIARKVAWQQDIEAELERLDAQVGVADPLKAQAYIGFLGNRRLTAQARHERALKLVSGQEAESRQHTAALLHYGELKHQRDRLDEDIDEVTQQISTLNLAQDDADGQSALNIEVLDPASVATAMLATSRATTLALFLFLGLLMGGGLSWLRAAFDQRLRVADDIRASVGLPVLSVVPHANLRGVQGHAIEIWEGFDVLSESTRSLRTAVYFGIPVEEGRVIQLTSPAQAEGKSLIVSQLGIAMARAGQKTLIIDADLRSSGQAGLFGITEGPGLSEMILTRKRAEEYIQRTAIEGLDVLLSGSLPQNPVEMLNSKDFEGLLARLNDSYDRVLVDSPPVLEFADAQVVATSCDASLLILRAEKTTRRQAQEALVALRAVGARVLGTVLNDVPQPSFRSRYGYGTGEASSADGDGPAFASSV